MEATSETKSMGYLIFAIAALVLVGQALKSFADKIEALLVQHPLLEAIWTTSWDYASRPIPLPLGLIVAAAVFAWLTRIRLKKRASQLCEHNAELRARAAHHAGEVARLEQAALQRDKDEDGRRERARRMDPKLLENQEEWLQRHTLRTKELLNGAERRIHRICADCLRGTGYRVLAQVSMGEFIGTVGDGRLADLLHSTYNSKRVDLLVCRADWRPRLVIEHMGSGHWLSAETTHRDRLKRNAIAAAGIAIIETYDHDTASEVAERIRTALSLGRRASRETNGPL